MILLKHEIVGDAGGAEDLPAVVAAYGFRGQHFANHALEVIQKTSDILLIHDSFLANPL